MASDRDKNSNNCSRNFISEYSLAKEAVTTDRWEYNYAKRGNEQIAATHAHLHLDFRSAIVAQSLPDTGIEVLRRVAVQFSNGGVKSSLRLFVTTRRRRSIGERIPRLCVVRTRVKHLSLLTPYHSNTNQPQLISSATLRCDNEYLLTDMHIIYIMNFQSTSEFTMCQNLMHSPTFPIRPLLGRNITTVILLVIITTVVIMPLILGIIISTYLLPLPERFKDAVLALTRIVLKTQGI